MAHKRKENNRWLLMQSQQTCSPPFVVASFSSSDTHQTGDNQIMLSAKTLHASYQMNFTRWRGNTERFHLASMLFRVMVHSRASCSELFAGLLRVCSPKEPCSCARRNVIPLAWVHWFQLIEPILLTFKQEHRQDPFENLKHETGFAVLVPSTLQEDAVMAIVAKIAAMLKPALMQVIGTAKIKLLVGCADNTVDARCRGDVIRHMSNCLSLVPCLFRCQAGKATRFSDRLITPFLDSTLDYIFFTTACKAEERS